MAACLCLSLLTHTLLPTSWCSLSLGSPNYLQGKKSQQGECSVLYSQAAIRPRFGPPVPLGIPLALLGLAGCRETLPDEEFPGLGDWPLKYRGDEQVLKDWTLHPCDLMLSAGRQCQDGGVCGRTEPPTQITPHAEVLVCTLFLCFYGGDQSCWHCDILIYNKNIYSRK